METAGSDRHFAGVNTRLLLELVEWRLGPDAVPSLLAAAGEERPALMLRDDVCWSSYRQFRALLQAAAALLGGPEELARVGELPTFGMGTMPEITAMLQAYGSPLNMATSIGHDGWSTFLDIEAEARGASHVAYSLRVPDGYAPFPELCLFISGLLQLSVRLFGLRPSEVREEYCQWRGDDRCGISIRWDEVEDLNLRLESMSLRLDVPQQRLESFQQTVADLVSDDDLDTVLNRIVTATARNTTAPYTILVADIPGERRRTYAVGLPLCEAGAAAERALAGDPEFVVLEIVSAKAQHGALVVPVHGGSLGFDRGVVESYARLAAKVLDAAVALERARRQATTTEAMFELARSLSDLASPGELAARVAHAMPAVFDCDCASVLLVQDRTARVAAHTGFDATEIPLFEALELDIDHRLEGVVIATRETASPQASSFLDVLSLAAVAAAPIRADDHVLGILVVGVHERPERLTADPSLADRFAGLAGQAAVALRNRELLDEVRHQSLHDPLTGLPNRALLLERGEQLLAQSRRQGRPCGALFIDLDGFKEINDTLGHPVGDEVLRLIAARLRGAVRGSDTVGRLGGDEFVVLADDPMLEGAIGVMAERLVELVREPFRLDGSDRDLQVGASIGIAMGDRQDAADLLRDADIALYEAKAAGKNCYRLFDDDMAVQARLRAELAAIDR